MIFDIVESAVGVSKWGESEASRSLSFQIVPKDRDYLEIGDKYVVSSAGYHRLLHQERERLGAKLYVTTDRSFLDKYIERRGQEDVEQKLCGWASFYPEKQGSLDYDPPSLEITVVVELARFDELFKLRIGAPGSAILHVGFEDLEFGWEPDGSHKIWKLDGESKDGPAYRKPVDSFWINVRTFSATEAEIAKEEERKHLAELAESPAEDDRKLAANLSPSPSEDAATQLLRHCRLILLGILAVAVFILFRP